MKEDGSSVDYVKAVVYVFVALGLFIIALLSAYFGGVGLYFGQGIVEQDVFQDQYKYNCNYNYNLSTLNKTNGVCNSYNTSSELSSWQDYQVFRTDINSTIPLYISATVVLFSLLSLVFLFLALRTSGLWKRNKGADKMDEY